MTSFILGSIPFTKIELFQTPIETLPTKRMLLSVEKKSGSSRLLLKLPWKIWRSTSIFQRHRLMRRAKILQRNGVSGLQTNDKWCFDNYDFSSKPLGDSKEFSLPFQTMCISLSVKSFRCHLTKYRGNQSSFKEDSAREATTLDLYFDATIA